MKQRKSVCLERINETEKSIKRTFIGLFFSVIGTYRLNNHEPKFHMFGRDPGKLGRVNEIEPFW